jgi:uncharacterized repeat protein (TIGR01451 family)
MNDKEQRFATMTTEEPGTVEARVRRRLITLAKIAFLIIALTCLLPAVAGAFSKKVVLDSSTSDFASGEEFYLVALTQQGGVAGVQLLAVGLAVDPGWVTETTASGQVEPLPYDGVTDMAATSFGGKLIIAGGVTGTVGSTYSRYVYTATVSQTASFSDTLTPWVTQTEQLPQPRSAAALVVSPTGTITDQAYLYLIGGHDGTRAWPTVYRSIFTPTTGQVGPWQEDPLPVRYEGPYHTDKCGLEYHSAVVFGGRIYVIGGENPDYTYCDNEEYSSKVYVAMIQSDGTLTTTNLTDYPDSWALLTQTLPMALSKGAAAVYDGVLSDTIYFLGGENDAVKSIDVYYTDILSDGIITQWYTSAGSLPSPRWRHGAGFSRGQLIVAGGQTPGSTVTDTVTAAIVKEDEPGRRLVNFCKTAGGQEILPPACTLGSWLSGPLLPAVRRSHAMAASGNEFFVMGGTVGDSPADRRNTVYHGTADATGGRYPPNGWYTSKVFDLKSRYSDYVPQRITHLEWQATMPLTNTGLMIQYRVTTGTLSTIYNTSWVTASQSVSGTNLVTITPPITTVGASNLYLQYRAVFTADYPYQATARLSSIAVYADLDTPDLQVSKVANQPFATSGKNVTYTIYCSNTGQVGVDAVLTDTTPGHTSIFNDGTWNYVAGRTYTRSLGTIAAKPLGAVAFTQTVAFAVTVDKDYTATEWISNTVQIAYARGLADDRGNVITDPTPYNNVATATLEIRPVQIAIGKSVEPYTDATAGGIVTYALYLTVTGDVSATATNVVITDHPDSRLTVLDYTNGCTTTVGEFRCGPWELEPSNRFVTYTARITSPLPDRTVVTNTTYADADQWPVVSATLTLTVRASPILQIVKDSSPSPGSYVLRGGLITYTLYYSNGGSANATGVVITDRIQQAASGIISDVTTPPGVTYNPASGIATWPTIAMLGINSGTLTTTFTVYLSSTTQGGLITNTAYISANNQGGVPGNVFTQSNVVTHTVVAGSLAVSKSAVPPAGSDAPRGSTINYTIKYTSTGNNPGIVLTDTLSDKVNFISCNPPTCGRVGNVLTWTLGYLGDNDTGTRALTVTVKSDAPTSAVITNTCETRGPGSAPAFCTPVTHTVVAGMLVIVKEANPPAGTAVLRGSYITYTIRITNESSTITATNVVVTDAVPLQTTYQNCFKPAGANCSPVGGNVFWSGLGGQYGLAPGESKAMSFTVKVITNATVPGVIENKAYTVTGSLIDPVSGSPVTHSLPAPVLSVSKSSYPASGVTVTVGSYIQYMLHYVNDSDQGAIGGKLFDFITGPVQIVNAAGGSTVTPPPPYRQSYNQAIRWDLGTIPGHVDAWKVIRVQVQVTGTGAITNLVVLSSTDMGDVVGNTVTHSVGTCGTGSTADLRIKSLTCINCSGSADTYYTVYTDSKLNISVKVQNDGGKEAASPFEICEPCSSPDYPKLQQCCSKGGTTTEIYAIHILSPTQPITPDNHTYGCEWDSVNHECTRQQYSAWPPDTYRYPTDCYCYPTPTCGNDSTKYVCPASIRAQGGSCTYTFPSTTTGTIELPIPGWWYIYAQADTYYDKSPWTDSPPTSPDWGAVSEGNGGCAESNNVGLVLVNVREKQQGSGNVYLPIIRKNSR